MDSSLRGVILLRSWARQVTSQSNWYKTGLFQESGNTYDSFMFNKIINKQIRMSYDRINDLGQKANFNQLNLP